MLDGERGAVRDIVLLNAAAGMVTFKLAGDASQVGRPLLERLQEQYAPAAAAVDSGAARAKLDEWVAASAALAAEAQLSDA